MADFPDYFGDRQRWRAMILEREDMSRSFDRASIGTICPSCGHHVWAHIIDGPDPVFVTLACPRDACRHEWAERVT